MNLTSPFELTERSSKSRRRKIFATVLAVAVVAHLIAALVSAVWIISRYISHPPQTFVSRPNLRIPPQILDPKLQSAEFEAAARKPVLDMKLASIKPMEFALPDVPRTPLTEIAEVNPSLLVSSSVTGLAGQLGGAGQGEGGGGGGMGTTEFFGVQAKGNRFVFVIDISASMVRNGQVDNFEPIVEEVTKALSKLTPEQHFGIVVFAGNDHALASELSVASIVAVERAIKFMAQYNPGTHLKERMKPGMDPEQIKSIMRKSLFWGTRSDLGLQRAFAMKPDVIVFLSDGEPTFDDDRQLTFKNGAGDTVRVDKASKLLSWVRSRQAASDKPVTINAVSYRADDGKKFMNDLATQNGGVYKDIR